MNTSHPAVQMFGSIRTMVSFKQKLEEKNVKMRNELIGNVQKIYPRNGRGTNSIILLLASEGPHFK